MSVYNAQMDRLIEQLLTAKVRKASRVIRMRS